VIDFLRGKSKRGALGMRWRRVTAGVFLAGALFFLPSCGSDSCTNPDENSGSSGDEEARASIAGLVAAFARSLEERDIEGYEECLTAGYKFEFTAADAERIGLPAGEPWWTKAPDMAATGTMFSAEGVASIEADLPVIWAGYVDDAYVLKCDPSIMVTTASGSGEPTVYWVFQSWLWIKVGPDEDDPDLWCIVEIREEIQHGHAASGALATEVSTWGGIKAMYR
jgi:hypothetical protein